MNDTRSMIDARKRALRQRLFSGSVSRMHACCPPARCASGNDSVPDVTQARACDQLHAGAQRERDRACS
eukprot:883203-Rhodomonas_salina.1